MEEGSGNSASPTPSPVSTRSLCPFLPSGTDPGSPADLVDETADVAIAKIPVLSVFAAATHASEFDAVLRKANGVTILVPTDDAFAADIPEDELEKLLIERHRDLQNLLRTHVIGRQRALGSLVGAGRASALSGRQVTFEAKGQAVRVSDDANVTCADVKTANATIHIIDSVIGYVQLTEPQEELG
ncbi:MAG TPA: fasciclin domain-containing protein [Actinomycetota bacterium]|nr:fasciclin domain-containing protein [Actinomycetota bacterium]